jgi:hypothetical protein
MTKVHSVELGNQSTWTIWIHQTSRNNITFLIHFIFNLEYESDGAAKGSFISEVSPRTESSLHSFSTSDEEPPLGHLCVVYFATNTGKTAPMVAHILPPHEYKLATLLRHRNTVTTQAGGSVQRQK